MHNPDLMLSFEWWFDYSLGKTEDGGRVGEGGESRAGAIGSETVTGSIIMMPFAGDPGYGYASILPPPGHPARQRFRQLCLPGHGERLKEPLLNNLDAMAADLFRQIANQLRPGDQHQ